MIKNMFACVKGNGIKKPFHFRLYTYVCIFKHKTHSIILDRIKGVQDPPSPSSSLYFSGRLVIVYVFTI